MDDLFRWMTVRPAQSADPDATVSLAGPQASNEASFQTKLASAKNTSPNDPWGAMVEVAAGYQTTTNFANPISRLTFGKRLQQLANDVTTMSAGLPPPDIIKALESEIAATFSLSSSALVTSSDFQSDWDRICNSIVALFITPAAGRDLLAPLAALLRMVDLARRVAHKDPSLRPPGALAESLTRTLLLPPNIFPLNPGLVKPAGIADLLVVRQRLSRYELADISTIENVLRGETKKHKTQHTLTTEHETVTEVEKTTTTEEETQSDERFDLKRETSNVIKDDLSVKAGVNATYKYGATLTVNANTDVSYDRAQSDSIKASSDYAKEITARSATKITERVFTQETHKVTEIFDTSDEHGFAATDTNNVGIYQFITKVYTAQVFNYGKRLLFDISVPEPAALYLDALTNPPPADATALTEPDPFTLTPADLVHDDPMHPNYYQRFLAKYQVTGFTAAPPPPFTTISAVVTEKVDDFGASPPATYRAGGILKIPDNRYRAKRVTVNGGYHWGKGVADDTGKGSEWKLTVGPFTFVQSAPLGAFMYGFEDGFGKLTSPAKSLPLVIDIYDPKYREALAIPWSISVFLCVDVTVTVEVLCELAPAALHDWKLKAHAAIVDGRNQQLRDYRDQQQQQQFAGQPSLGTGGNPDGNRAIERTELKRSAVEILSGRDLVKDGLGAVKTGQAFDPKDKRPYPRVDLSVAEQQGSFIRFFEQAFEWEQMTYLFYPYAWGRPKTWYDKAFLETDDPTFGDFLRAGAARVVVPVRPGFEYDVWYYLMTSRIWGGGDLPSIADSDYLPITEEIKNATGAPGAEKPQGDSWEIQLPAQLVRIRDDASLPVWTKTGDPWTWTSK